MMWARGCRPHQPARETGGTWTATKGAWSGLGRELGDLEVRASDVVRRLIAVRAVEQGHALAALERAVHGVGAGEKVGAVVLDGDAGGRAGGGGDDDGQDVGGLLLPEFGLTHWTLLQRIQPYQIGKGWQRKLPNLMMVENRAKYSTKPTKSQVFGRFFG